MKSAKNEYGRMERQIRSLQKRIKKAEKDNTRLKAVLLAFKGMNRSYGPMTPHARLISDICTLWNVEVTDIYRPSTDRKIIEARHVAMFAMRCKTELSLAEIGLQLAGKDHSTVIYAIKKVNDLAATDKSYMNKLTLLNLDKWLITS